MVASVVASEPKWGFSKFTVRLFLVLVGAVVFVVFFLLGSLGRGAPARPLMLDRQLPKQTTPLQVFKKAFH